jgi:hypothetical protein
MSHPSMLSFLVAYTVYLGKVVYSDTREDKILLM